MALLLPSKRLSRLPRGITAYWPLDASSCEFGSGQVRPLDLIGNNYGADAVSMGAAGLPPFDQGGIGFNLNASTSTYLTLNADPLGGAGAGNQSLMGWFYYNSFTSNEGGGNVDRLWGFQTDVVVAVDDSTGIPGRLFVDINAAATGDRSSAAVIPLNRWTHVAITISGTTIAMYVNGAVVAGTGVGNGNGGAAGIWGIGCRTKLLRIMDGKIAHQMVCQGTVLSAAEIADDYNSFFAQDEVMPALFTAGSSFLAAWANNNNLPVLGTGTY